MLPKSNNTLDIAFTDKRHMDSSIEHGISALLSLFSKSLQVPQKNAKVKVMSLISLCFLSIFTSY